MQAQNTDALPTGKVCKGCDEFQPLAAFSRQPAGKFGRTSQCKTCTRERTKRWRHANPEKSTANKRDWQKRHPEKTRAMRKRSVALRKAAGVPANTFQWHAERLIVLDRDDGVCGICGLDVSPFDYHLDHVIPIVAGGPHTLDNLQLAHPRCNNQKHTEVPS